MNYSKKDETVKERWDRIEKECRTEGYEPYKPMNTKIQDKV